MRKKILFVPSWYPNKDNPVSGVFIQEQALALTARYDVAVLIPDLAAWRNIFSRPAETRSRNDNEEGLLVYREFALPIIPHGPESVTYNALKRAAHQGFKKLMNDWGRPDVLHAHVVLPAGWIAESLGRHYGIPVVLTEHSSPFAMHLGTKRNRELVEDTLTYVDRIVAVSPALAEQIRAVQPKVNVSVVGELVRTDFFVPASSRNGNESITRFLFAALLTEQKGLIFLIEAIQLLLESGLGSFELLIGGDGPDRARFEQMTKSLNLSDRCKFLGLLDRNQIRYWMQYCDVFVLPSLHETFGIVVGEAMACGKPVIATRCGGPEFIVQDDTGILVDAASPEALASSMTALIQGKAKFDSLAIRESVVRRFGEDAFLNNISTVYEDAIQHL